MSNRAAPFAPALAVALLAAGALAPQPAAALRVVAQATAICQGALPAFETQIRKRPLALQNEGEANAFVTCSFNNPGQNSGGTRISGVTIHLQTPRPRDGGPARGSTPRPAPTRARAVCHQVDPGAARCGRQHGARVPAADFPGGGFLLPGDSINLSCNLAAGRGITSTVLVNNNN